MLTSRGARRRLAFALMVLCAVGLRADTRKKKTHHHPKHVRHAMKNGNAVERRSNGRISDVHNERRHMDIHHGLNGDRRVSVTRADQSRIVAERGRPGYVERPYAYRGHDFYRRTYYYHGHVYEHFYRGYLFRGVGLRVYAPAWYYPIWFYGWAYHPWRARVVYAWGWGGRPWYGYYGYYFAPYPAYGSASAWLTDRILGADLEAAYEAGREGGTLQASGPAGGGDPALTPEVKDQIAQQVNDEIALENEEAALVAGGKDADPGSSGIARLLADGKPHVFVVGHPLEVVDEATEADCALSDGDVLQLKEAPPADEPAASLVVLAGKGGAECAKSAAVTVSLDDLQEMQNHMREGIDSGLEELRQKQGVDGLPALPAAATADPTTAAYAPIAPPPDPNEAAEVQQQEEAADQAETEVVTQEKQEQTAEKPPAASPPGPH